MECCKPCCYKPITLQHVSVSTHLLRLFQNDPTHGATENQSTKIITEMITCAIRYYAYQNSLSQSIDIFIGLDIS